MNTPNLLFVYVDEMRRQSMSAAMDPDVGIQTPFLDAFANQAVIFDQAIVEVPVCCPSRSTTFTGKRAFSHGCLCLGQTMMINQIRHTLFSVLHQQGYHIGYFGKYHLPSEEARQWMKEHRESNPDALLPYQGPYGIQVNPGAKYVPPVGRPGIDCFISGNSGSDFWQSVLFGEDPTQPEIDYGWEVDILTRRAIRYLQEERDKSKPFACFVSYNPPHPGNEHDKQGNIVRSNRNVAPVEWEQKYEGMATSGRKNFIGDEETYLPGYYGAISSCDAAFGQLLQVLEQLNELENTLVVFTSDHGDLVGSHGHHAKSVWYEESIGVPLLIGQIGRIQASRQNMIFSNVHLMPTILGAMNLPIPADIDGHDFSGVLFGRSVKEPDEEFIGMMPYIYRTNPGDYNNLIINMNRANGSPSWWGEWRGIRTNRHTYAVQYFKGTVNRWLYDNEQDPFQMSPIHNEKLFAEFDARVRKWLHPADPFSSLVGWE